jgi:hypothetical protein
MVNYKKWFFFTLCSLVGITFLYLFSVYHFNFLGSGDVAWINDVRIKKEEIARRIAGQKVVFGGGSATLFGVKAKVIEDTIGIPCVNLAIHGGLNIGYVIYNLKKVIKKGDIVILPLEYSYFTDDGKIDRITFNYVVSYDKEYFRSLTYSQKLKILLSASIEGSLKGLLHTIAASLFKESRQYDSKTLNKNGDETINVGNDDRMPKFIRPFEIPSGDVTDTYGLSRINEFNLWCKENNITLYITYPNLIYSNEYEKNTYRDYFDKLNKYFVEHNIRTIGSPYDVMFEKELFYDTKYHLNQKGADIRTKQLIDMLIKYDVIKFAKIN